MEIIIIITLALVGGILNIFGDYFLIVVLELGVYGAGMSTAISQIVSFLILLIFY